MEAARTEGRTRWNVGGTGETVADDAAHATDGFAWGEGGVPGMVTSGALS